MKTPLIVGAGLPLILVATALAYVVASRDDDEAPTTPTTAADTPTTTPIPVIFEPYNQRAMAGVGWDPGPKPPSPFPT